MSDEPATVANESAPLAPAYTEALRIHSLKLVALGYARMTPADFVTAEEDAITGELTREMKGVLEDPDAPDWMESYSVTEQVRANTRNKLGKRRPIIDIEFERLQRGRRPRLRFEAKRLGPNHPASGYFGDGGLEAFVTGYYDRTHEDAGMLGYVQSYDEPQWAVTLSNEAVARKELLGIANSWRECTGEGFPSFTYKTEHDGPEGDRLDIYHVLLRFV